MKMRTCVSVSACCLVVLSATAAQTPQEELDLARETWAGYQNYDFHYFDNCYPCPEERWMTKRVSVRNNTIESVAFHEYWGMESSEIVPENIVQGIRTVDELFDFIQDAIDLNLESLVYYHYRYGYPQSVVIKFNVSNETDVDLSLLNMVPLNVTIERQENLTVAKDRWDSLGSSANQNYNFIWERFGFLPPEYLIPVLVQVRNGSVFLAVNAANNSELPEGWFSPVAVPEMFDMIEGAIAGLAPTLDVSYHEREGYPLSIVIDYDEGIADEELYWYISNLTFVGGAMEETPPPCHNTMGGCRLRKKG